MATEEKKRGHSIDSHLVFTLYPVDAPIFVSEALAFLQSVITYHQQLMSAGEQLRTLYSLLGGDEAIGLGIG
jgi:hypothetical protein